MKLLELERPTTVYVLQRFISNEWRLIYFDEAFIDESIFADVNWDSNNQWLPFSTKGECYKNTGLPGTFNKAEAVSTFNKLKKHYEYGAYCPIRLTELRIQVVNKELDLCIPSKLRAVDAKSLEERRIKEKRRKESTVIPNLYKRQAITST